MHFASTTVSFSHDPCYTPYCRTSPFFDNTLPTPPRPFDDVWIWALKCMLEGGAVLLLFCLKQESRLYFMNQGWLFSVDFYGFHSWAGMSHNHHLIFSNQGVTHFALGPSRLSVKGRKPFLGLIWKCVNTSSWACLARFGPLCSRSLRCVRVSFSTLVNLI